MLTENLLKAADTLAPEIIALRRAIHAEPELGLHCPMTMAKVRHALADLPLEWRSGPSTTGEVATLVGGKAGAGSSPKNVKTKSEKTPNRVSILSPCWPMVKTPKKCSPWNFSAI